MRIFLNALLVHENERKYVDWYLLNGSESICPGMQFGLCLLVGVGVQFWEVRLLQITNIL